MLGMIFVRIRCWSWREGQNNYTPTGIWCSAEIVDVVVPIWITPCSSPSVLNRVLRVLGIKSHSLYELCLIIKPKDILLYYALCQPHIQSLCNCHLLMYSLSHSFNHFLFGQSFSTTFSRIWRVFTQYTMGFIRGSTSRKTSAMRMWINGDKSLAKRWSIAVLNMGA